MKTNLLKRLGPIAAALALVGGTAGSAHAATISSGHVDVLDVDLVSGAFTLNIHTASPADDNVDPATTIIDVPASTLTTIPNSNYGCLGASGSSVYVLPQSESTATSLGAPWAGWNTQGVPSGGPASVNLVLDPATSTMPAGATFALYTTSLGTPTFRFNTNTTGSCAKSTFTVNRNVHGHGAWAFTQPGIYTLRFQATGSGATASPWVTYTFDVG